MMRKGLRLFLFLAITISCIACGKKESKTSDVKPEAAQMRNICELATMDCYYHNVAKYDEKDASGFLWWKKDRKFWVEYAGVVRIGVDVSKISMEVQENIVTITIPEAKVLSCTIDEATLTEDSFIVADGSAKVEAEHQTEVFKDAQEKMEKAAKENTVILANAQQRAQNLLEDYVKNIGNSIGKTYEIKWVYLEEKAEEQSSEK